jgi:hypothetical protein
LIGNRIFRERVFRAFQREYNTERPHAALKGAPPAAHYMASARSYPTQMPALEYPGHFLVKRVTNAGTIRFKHKLLFLANALKQHHVGLKETDDGVWSLYLGTVLLGHIDEREMKVYG